MGESTLTSDPILDKAQVIEGYKVLGGVVLYQKLGQGGMGAVYRGKHMRLGVDVALKVMAPPVGMSPTQAENFIQRFVREAKAAAAIKHQNLIRVYDVNVDGGIYHLIMDFIDGESAGDRIKRKGALCEQEAVEIALGAAQGLGHAHKKGIVHRDVKPDNILVDKEGNVVVADLGLAKAFRGGETDSALSMGLSMTQQAMGTPFFMSPEQTRSAKDVGPRADVWSLGVSLYQLMADDLPWRDTDLSDLIQRIRNDAPPQVGTLCEASEGLCAIVHRSLEKDPEARYPDCAEMADALADHLDSIRTSRKSVLPDSQAGTTKMALLATTPPPSKTMTFIGKSLMGAKAERVGVGTPATRVVAGSAADDLTLAFDTPTKKRWVVPTVIAGGLAIILVALLALLLGRPAEDVPEAGVATAQQASLEEQAKQFFELVTAAVDEDRLEDAARLLDDVGAKYDSTVYGIRLARLAQTVSARMAAAKETGEEALQETATALTESERAEEAGDLKEAVRVLKASLEKRDDPDLRSRVEVLERALEALRLVEEAVALEGEGKLKEALAAYERAIPDSIGEGRSSAEKRLRDLKQRMVVEETLPRLRRAIDEQNWRVAWNIAERAHKGGIDDPRLSELSRRVVDALAPPVGRTGPLGLQFVLVPSGEFLMGQADGKRNERPVHRATVSAFYLGRHEVTAVQLEAFRAKRPTLPAGTASKDSLPAVGMTWQEASAFCASLPSIGNANGTGKYRLPTEAEWEFAARGSDGRIYPWGNELPGPKRANLAGEADGYAGLAPVGSSPDGNTPLGISDMIGNAAEWCADWYAAYKAGAAKNPMGPAEGKFRVIRGSAFAYDASTWSRAATRGGAPPGRAADTIGFRVVQELTPEELHFLKLRSEQGNAE